MVEHVGGVAMIWNKIACTHSCVYIYVHTFIQIHLHVRAMKFVGYFVWCGKGGGSNS